MKKEILVCDGTGCEAVLDRNHNQFTMKIGDWKSKPWEFDLCKECVLKMLRNISRTNDDVDYVLDLDENDSHEHAIGHLAWAMDDTRQ